MSAAKRIFIILSVIVVTMLIVPFIAISTVSPKAGMLVTILMFFAVNPVVSIYAGIFL